MMEIDLMLKIASIVQMGINVGNNVCRNRKEARRFQALQSMVENLQSTVLTEEKLAEFTLDTQYRKGSLYLSDALRSDVPEIRKRNIEQSFDCFTAALAVPIPEEQRHHDAVKLTLATCRWGRYLYYSIHEDQRNMLRQVLETNVFSPSYSRMFFPSEFFQDEDSKKAAELEAKLYELWRWIVVSSEMDRCFPTETLPVYYPDFVRETLPYADSLGMSAKDVLELKLARAIGHMGSPLLPPATERQYLQSLDRNSLRRELEREHSCREPDDSKIALIQEVMAYQEKRYKTFQKDLKKTPSQIKSLHKHHKNISQEALRLLPTF